MSQVCIATPDLADLSEAMSCLSQHSSDALGLESRGKDRTAMLVKVHL